MIDNLIQRIIMKNKIRKDAQIRVELFLRLVEQKFALLEKYGYIKREERLAPQYDTNDVLEVLYKNSKLDLVILFQVSVLRI